ncbi:unnamed protein product [Closterium sp. NIES-54]
MQRYPKVPWWWFLILLLVNIAVCIAFLELNTYFQLPWWGLLLSAALSFFFTLPIGIVTATTNQQPGLNIITEMIWGYIRPGEPIGNVCFKTYGYISMTQAIAFLQDFKLGHYMKLTDEEVAELDLLGAGVIDGILSEVDGASVVTPESGARLWDTKLCKKKAEPSRLLGGHGANVELGLAGGERNGGGAGGASADKAAAKGETVALGGAAVAEDPLSSFPVFLSVTTGANEPDEHTDGVGEVRAVAHHCVHQRPNEFSIGVRGGGGRSGWSELVAEGEGGGHGLGLRHLELLQDLADVVGLGERDDASRAVARDSHAQVVRGEGEEEGEGEGRVQLLLRLLWREVSGGDEEGAVAAEFAGGDGAVTAVGSVGGDNVVAAVEWAGGDEQSRQQDGQAATGQSRRLKTAGGDGALAAAGRAGGDEAVAAAGSAGGDVAVAAVKLTRATAGRDFAMVKLNRATAGSDFVTIKGVRATANSGGVTGRGVRAACVAV